ncbi:MAG: GvpL/GvpF family gas vesicle protein [Alphaproteobacteria bacterium]|nr:GvpL/GvpF family gas vesicle protein [Alphaproteobacteria bacterium]
MNNLTDNIAAGLLQSTLRVFGFTDDEGCMTLKKNGGKIGDQEVMVISNGMLHALVGQEPLNWPWNDTDRVKLQRLMHYHRMLGAVTVLGKVIPASFDSVFQHQSSIVQALAHHQRDIVDLLGRYGTSRQFSLIVRWDNTTMQQLMTRFPKNGATANAIENERRSLRDQMLLQLQRHLQDIIILENNDNDVVLQAILLIEAHQEERVVNILQQMDKECRGRLDMRLTGPLPACNFARVEVKLPDRQIVKQACRDLGIGAVARMTEVKNAYRARVKNLHPDNTNNTGSNDVMVRLTQSYRYLTRLAAQQNNGQENNPDKQWLRCDHQTLRQTPLMRIQRGVTRWDDAILKRA